MKTKELNIIANYINLSSADSYLVDKYPNTGFYIVIISKIEHLYYVNKETTVLTYIDTVAQVESMLFNAKPIKSVVEKEVIQSTNNDTSVITGDVLLKTIAMIANNEKFKDLK